ncbi:MAG TPA: phosphatase PAP2 family protein, partial [Gaiellaceae bacterium]|nr:phosphatase PAP2 family protein [Gaiellaceae bacterium]
LFVSRRASYLLLRRAMMVSGAIGFAFFALLPVAPPRLLPVGLVDTVADRSESYRALQPPSLTNQYAAMPSLHFGWNLLVGIVLFLTFTTLAVRVFAVLMPAAMGFAVIATANHYVLDVVVGAALVLIGLAVASRLAAATLEEDDRPPIRDRPPGSERPGRARTSSGARPSVGRG